MKHTRKRTRRKKGKDNEGRFLQEMIGQEEEEEEEEEGEEEGEEEVTRGGKADNNKANNDDSKSVWFLFGSSINSIDPSNRIMADLFIDHYYTVTSINTVFPCSETVPNGIHSNILG